MQGHIRNCRSQHLLKEIMLTQPNGSAAQLYFLSCVNKVSIHMAPIKKLKKVLKSCYCQQHFSKVHLHFMSYVYILLDMIFILSLLKYDFILQNLRFCFFIFLFLR